jgi:hypothetical protein
MIHHRALQYSTTTVDSFEFAVEHLFGATRTVSPRVREAVREGAYYSRLAIDDFWTIFLFLTLMAMVLFDFLSKVISEFVAIPSGIPDPLEAFKVTYHFYVRSWQNPFSPSSWVLVPMVTFLVLLFYSGWTRRHFKRLVANRYARTAWEMYDVPSLCAVLIGLCALARMVSPDQRKDALRRIDIAVTTLTRALLKIPSDGQIFPRGSARRGAVRDHVKLVAAALQKATLGLDERPGGAPREVASLAFLICNRYVDQRWGALLDERQLAGLVPIHDREPIRLAVAVTLSVGAAVGVVALGVPSTVAPWVMSGVAVLVFTGLLGRGPKGLELLDSLRGIQRP